VELPFLGAIIILDKPTVSFSVNSIVCANTSVYFNNTTIAGFTNDCVLLMFTHGILVMVLQYLGK
jgi:hypothetical protein